MAAKDNAPMSPERAWFMIRLSMPLGVLLFAAVSLWTRNQTPIETSPEVLDRLRWATYGFSVAAIGVALVIKSALVGKTIEQKRPLTIAGWAAGEAAALIAVVQHFQGGNVPTMVIGMLAFASVLVLLPIPTTAR
jgi:hypothetical protein